MVVYKANKVLENFRKEWENKMEAILPLQKKYLGILVDTKLSIGKQGAIAAQVADGILGCVRESRACRLREVSFPSAQHW